MARFGFFFGSQPTGGGTGVLAGSSSGTSVVAGLLVGYLALAGTSAGTSTTAGTLKGKGALAGTSAGVATATATLSGIGTVHISGTAAGTCVVSGNCTRLNFVFVPIGAFFGPSSQMNFWS